MAIAMKATEIPFGQDNNIAHSHSEWRGLKEVSHKVETSYQPWVHSPTAQHKLQDPDKPVRPVERVPTHIGAH